MLLSIPHFEHSLVHFYVDDKKEGAPCDARWRSHSYGGIVHVAGWMEAIMRIAVGVFSDGCATPGRDPQFWTWHQEIGPL